MESEEFVPAGIRAEIRAGTAHFHGTITDVDENDLGWRIEIEFSPMTPWSVETFLPEHLLDPSSMEG